MIAYRAETRMMAPVIGAQGKKPNARRLLRALLTSDANIIPEPAHDILRIQLLGLGSDACDRMLAPLIEELNAPAPSIPAPNSPWSTRWPPIRRSTCHPIPAEVRKSEVTEVTVQIVTAVPVSVYRCRCTGEAVHEGTVFSLLFDVLEIVGDIPGIPFRKRTRYRRPQPNPRQ